MDFKLSCYHVTTSAFFDQTDNETKRIVYSTRTTESVIISDILWKYIEGGNFDILPTITLRELVDIELIVPSDENELDTIIARNQAAITDKDTLYYVIQPTAYCQLGCGYCGQTHSLKWLNKEHQQKLLDRIHNKLVAGHFRKLKICWFGAEPLSGISVIRSLTPKIKELTNRLECDYDSKIVTNGLALTENLAIELVTKHFVSFIEVTLDGDTEYHDARRFRKDGTPTFEAIFANIVTAAKRNDLNMELRIRCNVDKRNYQGVSPLLQKIADAGIQKRVGFYIAPIHSWGNDAHQISFPIEEFADLELDWFVEMLKLGFSPMIVPERKPVVCMAVQPHAELVDANGTVFNCTEVSYVESYGNPNKFAVGHLDSETSTEKLLILGDFNSRVRQGEYPCSRCRMLPVCGGSCPKQWQENLMPCPSTKFNIEERLLLDYYVSKQLNATNINTDLSG